MTTIKQKFFFFVPNNHGANNIYCTPSIILADNLTIKQLNAIEDLVYIGEIVETFNANAVVNLLNDPHTYRYESNDRDSFDVQRITGNGNISLVGELLDIDDAVSFVTLLQKQQEMQRYDLKKLFVNRYMNIVVTQPGEQSLDSKSEKLLSNLRAVVSLAVNALERDNKPVRFEIAAELRSQFGKLYSLLGN